MRVSESDSFLIKSKKFRYFDLSILASFTSYSLELTLIFLDSATSSRFWQTKTHVDLNSTLFQTHLPGALYAGRSRLDLIPVLPLQTHHLYAHSTKWKRTSFGRSRVQSVNNNSNLKLWLTLLYRLLPRRRCWRYAIWPGQSLLLWENLCRWWNTVLLRGEVTFWTVKSTD